MTYYPSAQYQQTVDNGTTTIQKTYIFGSITVAVRTISGSQNVLNWVVTDQISSTTVTASASGDLNSEIRYTAFGTIRYENGITPTDYRYTGQLQQAVIGLDYYNARWYDPELGRFIQADSIVADPHAAASYDRYSYVANNPINRTDPTGHATCDDMGNCYMRPGESRPMQSAAMPNITVHYITQTTTSKSSTSSSKGLTSSTSVSSPTISPSSPSSSQSGIKGTNNSGNGLENLLHNNNDLGGQVSNLPVNPTLSDNLNVSGSPKINWAHVGIGFALIVTVDATVAGTILYGIFSENPETMAQATFEAENIPDIIGISVPMGGGILGVNYYGFKLIINGLNGK